LWVILHHLTGKGQDLGRVIAAFPDGAYSLLRGGYLAVPIFFSLSGFVLARNYGRTRWSARNIRKYSMGRVARIYPVYLLSLALVSPFILEDQTPGKGFYEGAYALLVQGWLGPIPVNWNTPAWTLSCEVFFYAAFPLLIVFFRRPSWTRIALVAVFSFFLTRWLWAAGVSDGVKPLIHLSDFLMGLAAAGAYDLLLRGGRVKSGVWLSGAGVCAAVALIAYPSVLHGAIDVNTALRPLNALMLVGFGLGGGALARALSSRVVAYLGKSSYAMYILHVPILWWYQHWTRTFSPLLYVTAVIVISAVVYGLFEEPANRRLRRLAR
jgi:peptidoglycan/LPS O-acetylase OafA/YrhL